MKQKPLTTTSSGGNSENVSAKQKKNGPRLRFTQSEVPQSKQTGPTSSNIKIVKEDLATTSYHNYHNNPSVTPKSASKCRKVTTVKIVTM